MKNILHDVPEGPAVDIGREFARRIKNILNLVKEEIGFATPYKDFIHHHMPEINDIITYAIATPAGLRQNKLDCGSVRHQLRIQQCWQSNFSVIQWPRHLDYMRVIDEEQKLWKFAWKDLLPKHQRPLIDSFQDVRIFQRSKIASLLAEKENHSLELHKSSVQRFRGLSEYLIGKNDRMIHPFTYPEFKQMDKKFHQKIGRSYRIIMMFQPWKGIERTAKNHSAKRARSRSQSMSRNRGFRSTSVSPCNGRKIMKKDHYPMTSKSVTNSMISPKMEKSMDRAINASTTSTADITQTSRISEMDQSNLNVSVAETTILSGMSQASSHTESLQNDKNVSFNVTGNKNIKHYQ